jgi:hypothetical protein
MKVLVSSAAIIAFASILPGQASAADLYEEYDVGGVVVDDSPPVVVERERVIERRYYGARGYVEDAPEVETYESGYLPAYYPDRRRYWRAYREW